MAYHAVNVERTTDHLVDLIYACLLGEATWQRFLDELNSLLPGGKSLFLLHDTVRNKGSFSLASGLREDDLAAYSQHYSKINPWMKGAAIRPIGVGVVSEQMLERADLVRTEYYCDFLRHVDCEAAVGVTITRENGRLFALSTLTANPDPDDNMAAAKVLTGLSPHLHKAFRFYRGQTQGGNADNQITILDHADIGVVVVGEGGALRRSNSLGDRHLGAGELVGLSRVGRVTLRDRTAQAVLREMVDGIAAGPRVHSYVVTTPQGPTKVTLAKICRDALADFFGGPAVAIIIDTASWYSSAGIASFAHRFTLTPAELKLADALGRGASVREAAGFLGIAEGTARQQLKSIFRKTGVSRQSELVICMHSLSTGAT